MSARATPRQQRALHKDQKSILGHYFHEDSFFFIMLFFHFSKAHVCVPFQASGYTDFHHNPETDKPHGLIWCLHLERDLVTECLCRRNAASADNKYNTHNLDTTFSTISFARQYLATAGPYSLIIRLRKNASSSLCSPRAHIALSILNITPQGEESRKANRLSTVRRAGEAPGAG